MSTGRLFESTPSDLKNLIPLPDTFTYGLKPQTIPISWKNKSCTGVVSDCPPEPLSWLLMVIRQEITGTKVIF